ncbi:MAG: DNA double-strand break repair nuclease NurA [Candidatus Bathyarchaeia archaeon]
MIEQIHYATTPKYNFPLTLNGERLPKKFIELSLNSMSEIREKCFQPWLDIAGPPIERAEEQENVIEIYSRDAPLLISPLEPIPDGTPIIAVDASSIKIGETESGIICAVRGAVVWSERRQYRYLRLGPFPFHITEENKRDILNLLGDSLPLPFGSNLSFMIEIQMRLCGTLERWIQSVIAASVSDSIILWDGTLTSRTSVSNLDMLARILRVARENSNIILSFSKASTIRFLGRKITDFIIKQRAPCLMEIDEQMLSLSSKNLRLLGKIYVAKLNDRGYPFRVDIDGDLPKELHIIAVQRLLGNELTFQGYPEALRLAHIFSTFTASDVIGVQRFITREYGLKVVTWPSIRKALFGPFGTGGAGD